MESSSDTHMYGFPYSQSMAFIRAFTILLPGFAAPSASSLPWLPCPQGCSANGRRQQGPPALAHAARCSLPQSPGSVAQPGEGHEPRSNGKNVPRKGCGVLQAVAVLEDTARGQSACLESASSCYIPTKVPEQHFSCSSLFLFLCAFPQKVCYAHRQPRASEQVGWCWTRGPQSGEDSAERKGRSSRAEVQTGEGGLGQALPPLLHQEMLLHGVSSLFPAAFSTLSTMASSSAMAPNLPMAVTRWGRRPGPRSVLESCLPTHSVPWRTRPALMWLTSFAAQDCCFLQWQARVYSISHCRALWSWKIYKCYNHFYYHLYTTFNVSTMWLTHKIHF